MRPRYKCLYKRKKEREDIVFSYLVTCIGKAEVGHVNNPLFPLHPNFSNTAGFARCWRRLHASQGGRGGHFWFGGNYHYDSPLPYNIIGVFVSIDNCTSFSVIDAFIRDGERESLDTPLVLFLFYHNYMGSGYLNTYIRIPIIIFFRALTFSLPLSLVGKNL